MGTFYTNEEEFLAATTAFKYTLENETLRSLPQAYLIFDNQLLVSYPDDIRLINSSTKALFRGNFFDSQGFNAFGAYVNIIDFSNNSASPETVNFVNAATTESFESFSFIPASSRFFIGYLSDELFTSSIDTPGSLLFVEFDDNNTPKELASDTFYLGFGGEALLSPNITTEENLSSSNYIYAEYEITINNINSEENIETHKLDAQNLIIPSSISSLESFSKNKIYPDPYDGSIYIWAEKPLIIETFLNYKDKY